MPEAVPNEATEKEIHTLNLALDDKRLGEVERMINSMPASEIAFFLESLPKDKRNKVWELVDSAHRGEILVHLHDEVRTSFIGKMENQELISATCELELDDLADIIQDLPQEVSDELLLSMDRYNRELLKRVMSYPEDSAGGLMNPDVITIRPDVTLSLIHI